MLTTLLISRQPKGSFATLTLKITCFDDNYKIINALLAFERPQIENVEYSRENKNLFNTRITIQRYYAMNRYAFIIKNVPAQYIESVQSAINTLIDSFIDS